VNKHLSTVIAGAALSLLATIATAEAVSPPAPAQASIPFANHGGILNWQADRTQGLWMQDSRRRWYYATFMGSCPGINFANTLAFNTDPMGTFDRWSRVIVPRQGSCALRSVVASDGPPSKQDTKTAKVTPAAADAADAVVTADQQGSK